MLGGNEGGEEAEASTLTKVVGDPPGNHLGNGGRWECSRREESCAWNVSRRGNAVGESVDSRPGHVGGR